MTALPDRVFIGCGAGFSGDRVDAPGTVVPYLATLEGLRFLILETLGERTLADAQKARLAEPDAGFEPLLDELLRPILAHCLDAGIRIVSNCGAANPPRCRPFREGARGRARSCARPKWPSCWATTSRIGCSTCCSRPGKGSARTSPSTLRDVVAANAYLGCDGIRRGLDDGADIVVAGRVADPALVLGTAPPRLRVGLGRSRPASLAACWPAICSNAAARSPGATSQTRGGRTSMGSIASVILSPRLARRATS